MLSSSIAKDDKRKKEVRNTTRLANQVKEMVWEWNVQVCWRKGK